MSRTGRSAGSALLAVLWLTAALATIAFALASTVRGELERTSTGLDGTRAYYLATGALERALLYIQWGPQYTSPEGASRYFSLWTTRLHFVFPSGEADVDVLPESSKLDINRTSPEELVRLLAALGVAPIQAVGIAQAIVDWRTVAPGGGLTEFDNYYLSLTPSFRARHASFQEIEELLLVRGMTPDIFYGSFERDPQGRLVPRGGLADCVTVYGRGGQVDVNTAPPAVLAAVGLGQPAVDSLVRARSVQPFRSIEQLRAVGLPYEVMVRLGIGGGRVFTLRATARLRAADGKLSDLTRSVGETVRWGGSRSGDAFQVLRWQDHLWMRDDR
jgi:general secretion pathway protein K